MGVRFVGLVIERDRRERERERDGEREEGKGRILIKIINSCVEEWGE